MCAGYAAIQTKIRSCRSIKPFVGVVSACMAQFHGSGYISTPLIYWRMFGLHWEETVWLCRKRGGGQQRTVDCILSNLGHQDTTIGGGVLQLSISVQGLLVGLWWGFWPRAHFYFEFGSHPCSCQISAYLRDCITHPDPYISCVAPCDSPRVSSVLMFCKCWILPLHDPASEDSWVCLLEII